MNEVLTKIQSELKAPKNQYNNFGKYKYRSTEDILEALKPLLIENKASLYLSDEPIIQGNRYYMKATATFSSDEGSVVATGYAREAENKKGMDDSQISGTASSYARKYALNGLFLIDDAKDSDTNEYQRVQNRAPRKQTPKPMTESQALNYKLAIDGKQITMLDAFKSATAGNKDVAGQLHQLKDKTAQQALKIVSRVYKEHQKKETLKPQPKPEPQYEPIDFDNL